MRIEHDSILSLALPYRGRVGILSGVTLADKDDAVHCFGVAHTFSLISNTAGLFVSKLEVGRWVQAGDLIGQVYDGFDGELQRDITAPLGELDSKSPSTRSY